MIEVPSAKCTGTTLNRTSFIVSWNASRFLQVSVTSPEAQEAQDYLCKLPRRFKKLAERNQKQLEKNPREKREWNWLSNRVV